MEPMPNRIREYRKSKGWTLEQLGERAGCSYVHVSDLERGEVQLSLPRMRRFANAFGMRAADILLPEDNSESLSPRERSLIDRFRKASTEQQEQVARMMDVLVPLSS